MRILWLPFALALFLGACDPPSERSDPERPIAVTLTTEPARVGPATLEVAVGWLGVSVTDARVNLVGDMTHAGMMPVLAGTEHVGEGIYRSEGFAFDMSGDWVITAEVVYPDGEKRQGILRVRVAR
jgi:hypothetical protein